MTSKQPVLIGADGCPGGWLCVVERSGTLLAAVIPSLADAIERWSPTLLMVDIPVGLTEQGPRECDVIARQHLRPRRHSSVFSAPVRCTLDVASYAEANAAHKAKDGRGLSAQAFAIAPKIREVDQLLRSRSGMQEVVREVHPELCFTHWNGGVPMPAPKRTPEGRREREALIAGEWPGERDFLAGEIRGNAWGADDLNDALAALWTARRVHAGTGRCYPDPAPVDEVRLRMEMWA